MSWKLMRVRRWSLPLSLSAVLAPLACRAQSGAAEVAEDDLEPFAR
jgi:hypothetical protein